MTQPHESTVDSALVYRVRLPLSTRTLTYRADLLRSHLKRIGSRWRKLPPGRIALLVLAVLRHGQRRADLAGGNELSASTIKRWTDELLELLAARAPRLDRTLRKIRASGGEVVLLDGTLVGTRRRTGKDNRRTFSGSPPPARDPRAQPTGLAPARRCRLSQARAWM